MMRRKSHTAGKERRNHGIHVISDVTNGSLEGRSRMIVRSEAAAATKVAVHLSEDAERPRRQMQR